MRRGIAEIDQVKHRTARLIELDPKYVDVIVRRWQDYAGSVAVLRHDGRAFAAIEAGRASDGMTTAGATA